MDLWALLIGNIPALLCLAVGVILIVVEMMMPGFGVPGISGIALLLIGVLITGGTALEMMALAGIVLLILLIALPFCLRAIARGRLAKTKIALDAVSLVEPISADPDKLLGREGVAQTMLRPAGIALVGEERLNVVSDGEFISEGAKVRIEQVEGNRIVVCEVPPNT